MSKVFVIGMFKTGTTSVGGALELLGFDVMHGPWWPKETMILDDWFEREDEWHKYDGLIKHVTTRFDAFQDYPWMFCYKQCNRWYPDAKFILTERNTKHVALSDINMRLKDGEREEDIPPLQRFIDRYQNHYDSAVEFFIENPDFLVLNLSKGDGWKKLCGFLGKDIPDLPFPHLNKGKYEN